MKKKMPRWQKRMYRDGIIIGLLAFTAVGMLGEVARQNWHTKVTAYPTKTETAIETRAKQILDTLTLEEKVGQMFIIDCPAENQTDVIAQHHPGGFTLGADDFKNTTKNQVAEAIAAYQEASAVPMFIAVNEEGGQANSLSLSKAFRATPFLSARELFATGGLSLVETDTLEKCELLKSLGINMNYAPVADVATDVNALMYDRSVGRQANDTGRYVKTVVNTMNEQKVVSVLKHFPGYGNMTADEDGGIAVDDRSYEEFVVSDFLPFRDGMEADAPMVMVSHNIVTAMDPDNPASLSAEVHRILRRELGYEGVIITDALTAEELGEYDAAALAVAAVQAGNDLLCTGAYETQISAVLEAVRSGAISEERVDESVLRILKLKIQFDLI